MERRGGGEVRPKIEIVRVSSIERSNFRPLDGVQLRATYSHVRVGTYCPEPEARLSKPPIEQQPRRFKKNLGPVSRLLRRRHQATCLATKSCDNIYSVNRNSNSLDWRVGQSANEQVLRSTDDKSAGGCRFASQTEQQPGLEGGTIRHFRFQQASLAGRDAQRRAAFPKRASRSDAEHEIETRVVAEATFSAPVPSRKQGLPAIVTDDLSLGPSRIFDRVDRGRQAGGVAGERRQLPAGAATERAAETNDHRLHVPGHREDRQGWRGTTAATQDSSAGARVQSPRSQSVSFFFFLYLPATFPPASCTRVLKRYSGEKVLPYDTRHGGWSKGKFPT